MIWKLYGAILILFGAYVAGRLATADLIRRPLQLASLQRGILSLETEIGYGATPLPQAFRVAAGQAGDLAGVFSATARILQQAQGFTAGEAWQSVLSEKKPSLAFNKEDLQIGMQMGGHLGLSDSEDQLKRLALLRVRLQAQESAAQREREKMVKVWQSLSFALGFALILILF